MQNWLKENWIKIVITIFIFCLISIFFFKKDCSKLIPQNPYPEATSEYTGFEWSKIDRGSRNCEAYNKPFVDGCMEHIRQEIFYNKCIDSKPEIKKLESIKSTILTCGKGEEIDGYCFSDSDPNYYSPVFNIREWFLSIRQKDSCLNLLEDLEKKSGRETGFGGGTAFSDIATKIVHNYNNDQCVQISNKCKGSKNLECVFNIVLSEYIEK